MKTERNSDDLWTQRTLSTFQTFARGQDRKAQLGQPQHCISDAAASAHATASTHFKGATKENDIVLGGSKNKGNVNGFHSNGISSSHLYHQNNTHWNDSPPPPPPPPLGNSSINGSGHASLSPTSSSSSGESPKNSVTSSGSSRIYRYIENDNHYTGDSNNVSITHINGNGFEHGLNGAGDSYDQHQYKRGNNTNSRKNVGLLIDSNKLHKPLPVAVPNLHVTNGNASNSSGSGSHFRSRSMEGHRLNQTHLPSESTLVVPQPAFSAPFPTIYSSNHPPYPQNIESEFTGGYLPTEEDEKILEVTCALINGDKRFGFSVIGGREEGFPPCIDEITRGSPADKADLEVGDEILEVNGRSLEDATHTEVISHIHQCIRSRTICLRVKRRSGNKLALDLASQSNVQDAFVIAVEQQARERLEKLSALKKIKPVDMTKLSHQLSEAPSESGETSAELNGLIEAATGSPIYVTSASELNSSQSALHRTAAAAGEESEEGKPSSPARSTPTSSTVTTRAVISTGPEVSPSRRSTSSGHNNVTVVGVISTSSVGGTCLPNGQYSSGATTGDRSAASSVGEPVLPAKKSISKESVNGSRKSGSRESIADSRESVQLEGAKPSPSRSRGSASKLASQSSSRESVIEASTSSQYANMINMVEWDNGPHRVEGSSPYREMAVDVPESFVPRNKTPPRYPPTNKTTTLNSNNNKTAGKSVVSDGVGVRGNGAATLPGQNGAAGKPVPPPRIGDKEGVYGVNNNTTQVPLVTPRTVVGQAKTAVTTPSRDEAERIRKYQEELKKRREQEERHAKEEEFLRTSLRGSKKLQALESVREDGRSFPTGEPKGFVNQAYDLDGDRILHPSHDITLHKPVGLPELVASLQRVQQALNKHGVQLDEAVSAVGSLMQTPEFQQVLAVHNKVQDVWCFNAPPAPVSAHAQQLNQECLESLYNCSSPASAELVEILSRIDMDGVLHAHDKIAERERLLMTAESPLNAGEPVDPVLPPTAAAAVAPALATIPPPVVGASHMKSVPRPAFVPEPQPDDHIKVVRIEKTQDPLGATVRNEGDAVVIGRIVKGGAAERSGLLHEGDEILEVNGVEMRGKSVNEVCDILSRMTGTLTFLIVPTQAPQPIQQRRDILIHVRAHFDYDPEDDIYIPCRELGVAFAKGDVLHVINQEDPNWWQAHREGEEMDQQLAGLIPSKSFQEQREAVKQTLLGETETREKTKKGTLLCAKTHKKKKKKIPYSSAFNDEFDAEEIPTYEEVALYYPRTSFKRPVVLIGPPNIGRHELRQRLMQENDRFAAAVPHTSRSRKDGEIDGQDYHFISRAQFESDILSRKFVEHGEFEKAYYGTSLDAIRSVVNAGKICVLNLHPQSLKILRSSDLKPYIVFIAPPPLERLKQMRIARGEAYKEDELIDIIEKAREMDEKYGHYFDLVIVNNDIERTYHELVQRINYIEREPQWVPNFWLK